MMIVRKIANELRKSGITPYIAEENREPGCYLAEKIESNIKSSDWVIGLWTKDSTQSKYVNQELGVAIGANIPHFLFVEQGVPVEGFSVGREHIPFDPTDPSLGLKQVKERIDQKHMEKSDAELGMLIVGVVVSVIAAITLIFLATRKKKV